MVELKIYDIQGDSKTDITFSHNANFFLFTTLESARPIAASRGTSTSTPHPVLTGTPVAGMAYLDRPSPAGYFIFPDLSVRHEGKYRLSFNLFEDAKGKDSQSETSMGGSHSTNGKTTLQTVNSFGYRLEVKSKPFVVYSAKKFPGLTESTSLSRLVAEQGCRVRIRRDVRMRRRDPKTSKGFDDVDDEGTAYARDDRYETPDNFSQQAVVERARSASTTSVDPNPMRYMSERHSSINEGCYYNQQSWQPQVVAPVIPSTSSGFNTHLNFGNSASGAQCQPAASLPSGPTLATNGSVSQPPVPYSPSPSGYQTQQHSHSRSISNGSDYAYQQQAYQPTQYSAQAYSDAVDYKPVAPYRRQATSQAPASTRDTIVYPSADGRVAGGNQGYYVQSPTNADPRSSTPTAISQHLPPLKAIQPTTERKYEQSNPAGISDVVEVAPQVAYDSNQGYPAVPLSAKPASVGLARPGKRAYGNVFDTKHVNQPVQGGARPEATGQDVPQVECDEGLTDEMDLANLKMLSYRRADGSRQHKKIPSPIC